MGGVSPAWEGGTSMPDKGNEDVNEHMGTSTWEHAGDGDGE